MEAKKIEQVTERQLTIGQELRDWRKDFGPTSLVAAVLIGPGSIASTLVAGSGFGVSLLWMVALTGVWLTAASYMTGRITIATGKSSIENLDLHIFNGWGKMLGLLKVITNFIAVAFVSVGMADALRFFFPNMSNLSLTVIMLVITLYFVVHLGKFNRITSFLSTLIAFITVMFVVNMFFVQMPLSEIITGLIPTIPAGSEGAVAGIIGGSVGGIALLYYPYQVKAAGWTKEKMHVMKWDNIIMLGIPMSVVSIGVLISAAALRSDVPIGNAVAAAEALRPIGGTFATWIFVAGFLAAVWTTAVAPTFSTGYILADILKWKTHDGSKRLIDSDIHTDSRFKLLTTITLLGWLIGPLTSGVIAPFIMIMLAMGTINLFVPFLMASMLYIASSRKIMGDLKIGWFLKILVGISFTFSCVGVWSFITFVSDLF